MIGLQCIRLVDFKKAFDSVLHKELCMATISVGYPPHVEQQHIAYRKEKARVVGALSGRCITEKGV